jgi:hypothetical protein
LWPLFYAGFSAFKLGIHSGEYPINHIKALIERIDAVGVFDSVACMPNVAMKVVHL